jgi:hypothetical protein
MHVMYKGCTGLDVHLKTVAAWVLIPEGQETHTVGTITDDVLVLSGDCRRVAAPMSQWRA